MPTLLMFAACEKVILAQGDNTVSLITILQDFQVSIPENVQIPEKTGAPFRWCGFVMWHKQPEDEGKTYEQEVVLHAPDQTVLSSAKSLFVMTNPAHRIITQFPNFPIGKFGLHALKLYMGEAGKEKREFGSFPIEVSRKAE
jgi:hypothetical protein